MKRHRHHAAAAFAVGLATILLMQGCRIAMSKVDAGGGGSSSAVPSDELFSPWPIKFRKHNLGIHCFDTYGCKVVYDGRVQAMDDPDVLRPSSSSVGPEYRKRWFGGRTGFHNFPPPARVTWTSKDGEAHKSTIDFRRIFGDEVVRHNVPRAQVLPGATILNPDIHVEINNRTISVYMLASIPLRGPAIPGNPYSDMQYDLTLAYTETF